MEGTTLVTGATGFLGGALVRRLHAMGLPVIAQGRHPARLAALQAQGIPVLANDLAQPATRESLAFLQGVSTIIHCAARSAPHGPAHAFTSANVTATGHLLDTAQALGVGRFQFISSSSVSFAPTDQLQVRESDPLPPPFNAYAASKQQAEALVLERHPTATILRPRGIYGAGDTALLPRLLRAARRGPLPLLRSGQARIDLTHVDDVVDAVLAALNAGPKARGQVYNVSGGQVLPITEIVVKSCARAGVTPRWRSLPLSPLMAISAMLETVFSQLPGHPEPPVTRYGLALFAYSQSLDLTKARRDLGWQPRITFDHGLDLTFTNGPSK
jgi:nucleoside-diphosphate-sugar epimerase